MILTHVHKYAHTVKKDCLQELYVIDTIEKKAWNYYSVWDFITISKQATEDELAYVVQWHNLKVDRRYYRMDSDFRKLIINQLKKDAITYKLQKI